MWTLRAREDLAEARVTALAWRPDGKILAVGYDSGCVVLVDVEDANIVHENQLRGTGKLDLSHGSNVVDQSKKRTFVLNCVWKKLCV